MYRPHHRGYTLVEVAIVAALIGALAMLLFPVLSASREAARRAWCQSNLRELGRACVAYDSATGRLPGYSNVIKTNKKPGNGTSSFVAGLPPGRVEPRCASWAVMLLPYLEQSSLWEEWKSADETRGWASLPKPRLPIFLCPSDNLAEAIIAPSSYVGNCGVPDNVFSEYDYAESSRPQEQSHWTYDNQANGVFVNDYDHEFWGQRFVNCIIRTKPCGLDRFEATSSTLLFSENVHATTYAPPYYLIEKDAGFVWHEDFGEVDVDVELAMLRAEDPRRINGDLSGRFLNWIEVLRNKVGSWQTNLDEFSWQAGNDKDWYAQPTSLWHSRPSSQHPGLANAAFCDGHTEVLDDELDYKVLRQLMTSDDTQADIISLQRTESH